MPRPNHATVETPATKKARPAVEATAATNATELRLRNRQKRTENHATATKKARPLPQLIYMMPLLRSHCTIVG